MFWTRYFHQNHAVEQRNQRTDRNSHWNYPWNRAEEFWNKQKHSKYIIYVWISLLISLQKRKMEWFKNPCFLGMFFPTYRGWVRIWVYLRPVMAVTTGGAGAEKTANSELPRATAVSAQLDLEPVVRPRSFRRRVWGVGVDTRWRWRWTRGGHVVSSWLCW